MSDVHGKCLKKYCWDWKEIVSEGVGSRLVDDTKVKDDALRRGKRPRMREDP